MGTSELIHFSLNRLDGEPLPPDLERLLIHKEALRERFALTLESRSAWSPWLEIGWFDLSRSRVADQINPEILAELEATMEVCRLIAFVAADVGAEEFFGYWRGQERRPVAACPLVLFDGEGQFGLCPGSTLADALLWHSNERFPEMRDWLRSLGIPVTTEDFHDLTWPEVRDHPGMLRGKLADRYAGRVG